MPATSQAANSHSIVVLQTGCGLTIHSSRSHFVARLNSGVRAHMTLLRILVATSCLASVSPGLAGSPTGNCNTPSVQIAVDCLQPQLDIRIAETDDIFAEILRSVSRQSLETPEAKIDSASVIGELRIAREHWRKFAEHECAAARKFVGIGSDKNNVELSCLIQLYDRRAVELRAWRGL